MPDIIRTDITPRNNGSRKFKPPRGIDRPIVKLPWTADEEALFHSFELTHVPGTPWPIEVMEFFSRKNELDCRRWTQEALDPKILEERAKAEEDTGRKTAWDPTRISGTRKDRYQVRPPLTADEEAIYNEFASWHVYGTLWPINEMNQITWARGLDCRQWTPRSLQIISREERERKAKETEVNMARELAVEENPADEDGERSEGEESGNGGGSERGWIYAEDESRRKRSHSI